MRYLVLTMMFTSQSTDISSDPLKAHVSDKSYQDIRHSSCRQLECHICSSDDLRPSICQREDEREMQYIELIFAITARQMYVYNYAKMENCKLASILLFAMQMWGKSIFIK